MCPDHSDRPPHKKNLDGLADSATIGLSRSSAWVRRLNGGAVPRFWRDESGGYLVVAGLVMPAMVGVIGLASEAGGWYLKHRTMQNAADSAAISAATSYFSQGNATGMDVQAQAVTAGYGLVHGTNNVTVTTTQVPWPSSNPQPNAIKVSISQPQNRLFSALWGSGTVNISVHAIAVAGGTGCVVALDRSASDAVQVQGNATATLNGCSLYDNSSSPLALDVGGSATLSAQSVNVGGGISGAANISASGGIFTGQPPIDDPYASSSFPSPSGCGSNVPNNLGTITFSPRVFCGKLQLNAGDNVTLSSGIYYFAGQNKGDGLVVNGGATLTGNGVTLVFTSKNGNSNSYAGFTVNGSATINLTAMTTGPTAGIVIFGDRNMPAPPDNNSPAFTITGNGSMLFTGAVYVPSGAVTFGGGAVANGCLQLVADKVALQGNPNFAINCAGTGTNTIGPKGLQQAKAHLVE